MSEVRGVFLPADKAAKKDAMSYYQPWTDAEGRTWNVWPDQTVVECPVCAFSFDADHTSDGGGYSCPACAEAASSSSLVGAREAFEAERNKALGRSHDEQNAIKQLLALERVAALDFALAIVRASEPSP